MGRLILIRHCETDANAAGVVQGSSDPQLSERGKLQARLLADYLAESFHIDRVISSDRTRCVSTAQALDTPLSTTPLLRELDFGDWEGNRWSKLISEQPDEIVRLQMTDPEFAPPGGESISSLHQRLNDAIGMYGLRDHADDVAVVSHSGVLGALIPMILGWPLGHARNLSFFNGGVSSILHENGTSSLDLLNYYDHVSSSYDTPDGGAY